MWLKFLVFVLGACAYASHSPAWRHNHEYVYQIQGRILTGLNEISNKQSGILLKSQLRINPTSDGNLIGKLSNSQYASIHTELNDDWQQEIPDSEANFKDLPLSSKPFKIVLNEGVIADLIVDNSLPNWEANIIKGIVSQFQLDTDAENQIRSSINIFSQDSTNTAVFKTMEKTVTGESETIYDIHPFPAYSLQTEPWLAPVKELRQEKLIEVVKNINFTHSKENPSYYFGFEELPNFDADNKVGKFLSRTSVNRFVLSGNLKSYTIQSSVTVEQITVNPNIQGKQRGATGSIVNVTLESMQPQNQQNEDVSDPVSVGIVYRYNQPFAESNQPSPRMLSESNESSGSDSNESRPKMLTRRTSSSRSSSESSGSQDPEVYYRVQDQPHMDEAPASPLLPFTVGYDGQSIGMKKNIMENVRTLAKQIGQEYQQPEQIPKENTAGKFVILTSLVRVMNKEEMQKVSKQLYTKQESGPEAAAWIAFRDAVSQAGTGPSLLTIEEWIRHGQISEEEAAQVVATAARSVRTPTEKYMKVFFGMIKNEQFMSQKYLNESLLLSFSSLTYQVYVNEEISHNKYPVHSFGTFNTVQGRLFVEKEVIPYFETNLQEAISDGDVEKIHLQIHTLCNIGHRNILSVFKPYLEGERKASQFQRTLMVVCLDKLGENDPKTARSVFFKIYQNPKEFEPVRVAAVYQLGRARPTPSMLQRMAMYTNIDTSNQVNSAVKSVIESVANLQGPQYAQIREAAQSARPYLTSKDFGVDQPQQYLQSYISEEMKVEAKQLLQTFSGEDSAVPNGIRYLVQLYQQGSSGPVFDLRGFVSSNPDFINVFEQQTKSYNTFLKEKQAQRSVNTKWSSENTAKVLNMQNEQREQLEGYLSLYSDVLQRVWSFDNHTIENLTEVIRELEEELKNGKQFNYDKMAVHSEKALSFPTAWGLPFIYTYDRPTFIHVRSQVKAVAKPPVVSQNMIQMPETVDVEYQIKGFISGRGQSQFGFFVPFNHRRYSAGYDKNMQIALPQISGKVHIDLENRQLRMEAVNSDQKSNNNLVHFSTWPYTTQYEIGSVQPKTEVISRKNHQRFNTVLGEKSTGIAFDLQMRSDKKINYGFLYDRVQQKGWMPALLGSWLDDEIQHSEINLRIDSSRTTTQKMTIHLGHQKVYSPGSKSRNRILEKITHTNPTSEESWERQNQFLKESIQGISNVHAQVVDTIVLLEGQKVRKYSFTLSGGSSNIDPKGRVLMQAEQKNDEEAPVKVQIHADSKMPNPPNLDVDAALEFNPSSTVEIKGKIGRSGNEGSEVNVKVKLSQSEERKQHLKSQPEYQECQQQKRKGNNQLPPCAMLTDQANLLDQLSIDVDYKNIKKEVINQTYLLYSMLRQHLYPRISENIVMEENRSKNRLTIQVQYSPDLSAMNASVSSAYGDAEISNLPLNDLSRQVLVPHPAYSIMGRLQGYALSSQTYHVSCVADQKAVNTFDNKTYPVDLSEDWTVLLHYVPRRPSPRQKPSDLAVGEQLNQQIEGYIIYVRNGKDNSQKEVKMVIQSPRTLGKVIDITLKPADGSSENLRLFVQNEQIKYDDQATHLYDDYMQVYKLPNKEMKVHVYESFNMIYDGVRAKLEVLSDKFRDASRGLCGTFTGEEETDFTHPGNCIIRSADVFVATNTVPEKQRTKRMNDILMIQAEEKHCFQKTIGYVKVVSAQDSGLSNSEYNKNMRQRTKYITTGNQICFSIDPLPTCKSGYEEHHVSRAVPVHCVENSAAASLLKRQIDQGGNPSFKHKSVNNRIAMKMAARCE